MRVEERWQNEVKSIDNNLYIRFNDKIGRFEVRHKLPFHNIDRRLLIIHKNGDFRRIDYDILNELKYNYPWEAIYKYKDPDKLADWYLAQRDIQKEMNKRMREKERMAFISDNSKSFEKAKEQIRSNATPNMVKHLKRNQEYQDYIDSKKPKNF